MKKMKVIKDVLYSIYPEKFCDDFFKKHTRSNIRNDLRKLAKGQSLKSFFGKDKQCSINAMKIYRLLEELPSDPWSFNLTGNKKDKEKREIISSIIKDSWKFFRHRITDKLYTYEELSLIDIMDLKKSYLHYTDKYNSSDSVSIRDECYELSSKLNLYDVSWEILDKEDLSLLLQRMKKAHARMKEIEDDNYQINGRVIEKSEFYDAGVFYE